jgi:hypothetical protein
MDLGTLDNGLAMLKQLVGCRYDQIRRKAQKCNVETWNFRPMRIDEGVADRACVRVCSSFRSSHDASYLHVAGCRDCISACSA